MIIQTRLHSSWGEVNYFSGGEIDRESKNIRSRIQEVKCILLEVGFFA